MLTLFIGLVARGEVKVDSESSAYCPRQASASTSAEQGRFLAFNREEQAISVDPKEPKGSEDPWYSSALTQMLQSQTWWSHSFPVIVMNLE